MSDSKKKAKPTLETLLTEHKVITGKDIMERHREAEKQKALLQEAIEFEQRNRRVKS